MIYKHLGLVITAEIPDIEVRGEVAEKQARQEVSVAPVPR